jgi:hypothetical protein
MQHCFPASSEFRNKYLDIVEQQNAYLADKTVYVLADFLAGKCVVTEDIVLAVEQALDKYYGDIIMRNSIFDYRDQDRKVIFAALNQIETLKQY